MPARPSLRAWGLCFCKSHVQAAVLGPTLAHSSAPFAREVAEHAKRLALSAVVMQLTNL